MPKILLIEDDNSLREIFEMRLQAEGYQTVTAGDGEEGLTVAMREKPDLIISDVMMPKLSGFEMLETLRAAPEGKNAKVIMMTALGQAEDRARGERLGVVKYLVKSQATLEDFARVVREVLPPGETTPGNNTNGSAQNNQLGKENTMQDQPQVPTNPGAADSSAPAADPMAPAGAPSSDQQSTAQEQSTVNTQVNDFVASAPASDSAMPTAPAADPGASFAPSQPVENPVSTPSAPDMGAASSDATSTEAPVVPPATPPADTPPATPPQTDAPAGDGSATPPADPTANAI